MSDKAYNRAYDEGIKAFGVGVPYNKNPYPDPSARPGDTKGNSPGLGRTRHRGWALGWCLGQTRSRPEGYGATQFGEEGRTGRC